MTELGEHQLKAIREMHNGCILTGGVGTGKTRTALVYFYVKIAKGKLKLNGVGDWEPPQKPTNLYVITTAKKRDDLDWEGEAAKMAISTNPDLGIGGINMVVDSWNNIGKYEGVRDAFFVFDEQRLVGSGAWVKAFIKIAKQNQWILLSATPGDSWMDYVPVFVANGFYKNRTEFQRAHVVYNTFTKFPKVDRYIGTRHLESLRGRLLVEMPYERHTTRHLKYVPVQFDQELYDRVVKQRWDIFNDKPLKDVSQMFVAMRRVVNNDVSRLGAVLEILESHPKLIIFYNYDYELETLRTLTAIGIHTAEWNGHKHQPIPEGDRWVYLVQYTAGAEGWNCVSTDAIAYWSLNYSYKVFEQSQGRIDRLNTPFKDLWYYVLKSNSDIDMAILRSLGSKKDFNERKYADSWPKTQN